MRRQATGRTITLLAIAICASAAAPGQVTPSPFAHQIPDEALGLHRDLVALKFDGVSGRQSDESSSNRWRNWDSHVTSNFVLLTDAGRDWSAKAGHTLERTQDAFYRAFRSAGFAPGSLDDRLVWVAFSRRDDFHQYALNIDRLDMSWSDGYYSTRTNRVALVCDSGAHSHGYPTTTTASEDGGADGSDSTEHFPQPSEGFTHLAQATHEAVHQLAFNSGIQKRGVMYPLWASEGLATNFEASGAEPFGPQHDNAHRRRQLLRAAARDGLIPLREFVVMTRVPVDDTSATHAVYAQSWAFFRFLFQHRPQQLRRYLAEMATLEPGRRDAATLRREFARSFGRIESLERSWQAYVRLMGTTGRSN